MKSYIVFLFQLMIWSGYSVVEWMSDHDRLFFNAGMFLVFSYLAVFTGKAILKSGKKTVYITIISLISYAGMHFLFRTFLPN
ncbi:hypothetical protein CVD28_15665 [Bacillus sp. M6-12]|uniref:hypothetical protein n=1 Tax=Bacillus sp. M6-12 TaxID=2054166 RepID=UPI000C76FC41|nr:hypothetical protein [Bacillus sp. M6-12]PLS16521.1 hypothetical protein CVD28_15665 [Bacillus sp. M6-12]